MSGPASRLWTPEASSRYAIDMDAEARGHIEEILEYWFGVLDGPDDVDRSKNELWWKGGPETDAEVEARFGARVEDAVAGRLDGWCETARGALAVVILLDQLTRNVYRGTGQAYAGDGKALQICIDAIARAHDRELRLIERSFLYMPMMHAEDRDTAERSLATFESLAEEIAACSRDDHPNFLSSAKRHAEIVLRFGRYPHRNALLNRESTPEEREYLDAGGPTFGQTQKR